MCLPNVWVEVLAEVHGSFQYVIEKFRQRREAAESSGFPSRVGAVPAHPEPV